MVWVAQGESNGDEYQVIGIIAIADMIRPEAAATITRLRKSGIEQIVMITGDNQRTAESVAQAVGLTKYLPNFYLKIS